MTMLVTLNQAKKHLHVTHTADDADITLKVHAASGAVINYLKTSAEAWIDSSGEVISDSNGVTTVPQEVQQATLVLLGWMYNYREGETGETPAFQMGYLPAPVTALLYPLRDPALA